MWFLLRSPSPLPLLLLPLLLMLLPALPDSKGVAVVVVTGGEAEPDDLRRRRFFKCRRCCLLFRGVPGGLLPLVVWLMLLLPALDAIGSTVVVERVVGRSPSVASWVVAAAAICTSSCVACLLPAVISTPSAARKAHSTAAKVAKADILRCGIRA